MYYRFNNINVSVNGSGIKATDAQIGLSTSLTPKYLSNNRYAFSQVAQDGAIGNFSVSYYLTGADPIKGYITNEQTAISGNFGGLYFNSGYLQSYSLNGSPNQPAIVNAEIVFFDELKGTLNPTFNLSTDSPVLNFNNASIVTPTNYISFDNITDFSVDFNSEILPKYLQNQTIPHDVHFGEKTLNATVVVDNVENDLPFSGKEGALRLSFTHPHIATLTDFVVVSGIVNSKSISTSAGSILTNSISITQNYVDNKPIVTSISPTTAGAGDTITVLGANLGNTYAVKLYGVPASFTINSDTQLTVTVPAAASSGILEIDSNGGSFVSGNSFALTYGTITVDRLIPYTGFISGNIRISGSNFYDIDKVWFGNNVSPQISILGSTLINATVPYNTAWDVVKVQSTIRNVSGQSVNKFVPVPIIDYFIPLTGVSGAQFTLSGQGFSGVSGVRFNNLPNIAPYTTNFVVLDNNTITGSIPTGNTKGYIKVFGQSGVIGTSKIEFKPLVRITGFTDNSRRTGESLEILGENFNPDLLYQTQNNWFLVDVAGTSGEFNRINSTKLTGIVPYGASSGYVYLLDNQLNAYPSSGYFNLNHPPPTITSFSPISGRQLIDNLRINGTNFYNLTSVLLMGPTGNISLTTGINVNSTATSLSFPIPEMTGGYYTLRVTTAEGFTSTNDKFFSMSPPVLSGYLPTSGAIGDVITMTGLNLYHSSNVYFNVSGNEAHKLSTSLTGSGFDSLSFYVPMSAYTGTQDILLYNQYGWITGQNFRLINKPNISGFNPSSGEWGANVSVSGFWLNNVTGVSVGSGSNAVYANNFSFVNQTGLTFTVPYNAGTDYLYLYSRAGISTSTGRLKTLENPIVFSGFTPRSGYFGDNLTISGHFLQSVNQILFSGGFNNTGVLITGGGFTKVGITGISLTVPQGIITGPIKLFNTRYTSSGPYDFQVIPNPIIDKVWPGFGEYRATINISGSGFFSGISFVFPNANQGISVSGLVTQLIGTTGATIQVPREIVNGPISISGLGRILSTMTGTFIPLPTITGFHTTTLTTGTYFQFSGINATTLSNYLFLSGVSGELRQALQGSWFSDLINVTGAHITNYQTGYVIHSGILNSVAATGGKPFVVNSYYTGIVDSGTFLSSEIKNSVNQITIPKILTVNESAPSINSFYPFRGSQLTEVNLSGDNLKYTTGVYIVSGVEKTQLEITQTNKDLIKFRPPSPTTYAPASGQFLVVTRYGNATSTDWLKVIVPPIVSGFVPTSSVTGQYIRITGAGLAWTTGLYFGDYKADYHFFPLGVTSGISGLVPFVSQETLPLQVNITVKHEGGTGVSSNVFTILQGPKNFHGDLNVYGNISGSGTLTASGLCIENITTVTGDFCIKNVTQGNYLYVSGFIGGVGYRLLSLRVS